MHEVVNYCIAQSLQGNCWGHPLTSVIIYSRLEATDLYHLELKLRYHVSPKSQQSYWWFSPLVFIWKCVSRGRKFRMILFRNKEGKTFLISWPFFSLSCDVPPAAFHSYVCIHLWYTHDIGNAGRGKKSSHLASAIGDFYLSPKVIFKLSWPFNFPIPEYCVQNSQAYLRLGTFLYVWRKLRTVPAD